MHVESDMRKNLFDTINGLLKGNPEKKNMNCTLSFGFDASRNFMNSLDDFYEFVRLKEKNKIKSAKNSN